MDFPKITALIGFDLVNILKVCFCFVDILKYQCKSRGEKVNFDIVNIIKVCFCFVDILKY